MSRSTEQQRKFRDAHDRLRLHARDLIELRRKMPKDAIAQRRLVSNMVEQILQIEDEADLQRRLPYMRYTRAKLRAALGSNLAQHMKEDPG